VLCVMVIATEPQVTLFILGLVYILSAPLASGYQLVTQRSQVKKQEKTL
jgi:hypothetical protein